MYARNYLINNPLDVMLPKIHYAKKVLLLFSLFFPVSLIESDQQRLCLKHGLYLAIPFKHRYL